VHGTVERGGEGEGECARWLEDYRGEWLGVHGAGKKGVSTLAKRDIGLTRESLLKGKD
jgi:hypothetical protein